MGVQVRAYSGLQLEKAGGTADDLTGDYEHFLFLDSPGYPQAADVPRGIYSYSNHFEEQLGSYLAFESFRKALAERVGTPYPGTPEDKERWRELRFGSLLYVPDNYGLLGPAACKELFETIQQLKLEDRELINKLAPDHQESYIALERAARLAHEEAFAPEQVSRSRRSPQMSASRSLEQPPLREHGTSRTRVAPWRRRYPSSATHARGGPAARSGLSQAVQDSGRNLRGSHGAPSQDFADARANVPLDRG
jgi:hypothetical protein